MKNTLKKTVIYIALSIAAFSLSACGSDDNGSTNESPLSVRSFEAELAPTEYGKLQITEIMPSNKATLQDSNGRFSDWIELTNNNDDSVSLKNLCLSDDINKLNKWSFPDIELLPGERRLVFCSGTEDSIGDELHAGFSLKADGEAVILSDTSGRIIQQLQYGTVGNDVSLFIDDTEITETYLATPGFSNDEAGREEFIAAYDRHGELVINEVVSANDSYYYFEGDYYDWFEVKNVSDSPILLSDYSVSDSFGGVKYSLPSVSLGSGDVYVVFCVGNADTSDSRSPTVPFSISSEGDRLYLFDSSGTLSDYTGIYDLPLRGSIGRLDDEPGFFLFESSSPSEQNYSGYRFRTEAPAVDVAPGIYNDVNCVTVELSSRGTIYYTTDGTYPTESSPEFVGTESLTATGSIRAIAVEDGHLPSKCVTYSYVINENHTLPVVCIACRRSTFDLVYWTDGYSDAYCDANVSYFGNDGSFSADCKIKLHGASSRSLWLKKNLKLVFSGVYGGDLNYDLFGTGEDTSLHSFTLRGGETSYMTLLRDELASVVADKVSVVDPLTLKVKYCILYVDGDYRGIYAIREAYSDKYAADHLSYDEQDMEVERAPVFLNNMYSKKSEELALLFNYIVGHDMRVDEYYDYVDSCFDLQSLANWMCLEAYFNNHDPTGNIRYCKSNSVGSKWTTMFFDLDQSLSNDVASWGIILDSSSQIGSVCLSMIRSGRFQTLLLQTAAQMIENGLNEETLKTCFNEIVEELEPEMERNLKKWSEAIDIYRYNVDWQLQRFTSLRTETWLSELKQLTKADNDTMHLYFPDYY